MPRRTTAMRFDQIMPAVVAGEVDAGLVIHEGRFTYRQHGLRQLADLGERCRRRRRRRCRSASSPRAATSARRRSPRSVGRCGPASSWRGASPQRPRDYVRQHAQELAADVCAQHIALYVNDFTVDLGERGRRAILTLLQRGRDLGLLPAGPSPFLEPA